MILRAGEVRGKVVDLDTGQTMRGLLWVDLQTGHFEAYVYDSNGVRKQDGRGNYLTVRGIGRFHFTPAQTPTPPIPKRGVDGCVLCGNRLTLVGDDLCPRCRAEQQPSKQARTDGKNRNTFQRRQRLLPLLSRKCDEQGCCRVASWLVADEVPVSFVPGTLCGYKAWFSRGMTVNTRVYCDFHYQPPRILDAKGEVVETLTNGGPDLTRGK